DGDGLGDVWTDADCGDENRVLAAGGPLQPEQAYEWEADVLLAAAPGEHVSYAWPVQLVVDDHSQMLAEGYSLEEPYPLRAYLFLESRYGLVTADADLTIDFDVPSDYAGGIADDLQVEAIPGESGGDIAVAGTWYEDYDWCGAGVWLVPATWTGAVGTAEAYGLGPDAALGYPSDCDGANALDAGDLDGDGDGNDELLLVEDSVADLYFGPFEAADGYRSPDVRLASFEFDEDYEGPWIRSSSALVDIDGDGTQDLVVVGDWNEDSGDWWGMLVVEPEAAGLSLATATPLVQTPYDGYMSLRGPVALDANGDGCLDFALGDNNADIVDGDEGRIYVAYGPFAGTRSPGEGDNAVIVGSEYKEYVGYDVAAGDTNGDGYDDLALSTRLSNDEHPGTIWIFLGGP
ncbi:MAG: FG-GAP repeat protein, partial [Deltaproteobacteria bacterium]|nr:FG-GAP repeat protein [Deltaproteobacteria bacterium]